MGELFKGWRRKTGVLTLLMACVFAAGWMRSAEWLDAIDPDSSLNFAEGIRILSGSGRFAIMPQTQRFHLHAKNGPDIIYHGRYFRWVAWKGDRLNIDAEFVIAIPYWSIVTPLTLLSAWLLFSKQSPIKRPTEPPKDET